MYNYQTVHTQLHVHVATANMQYNYLISVGLITTGWQLEKMADYMTTLGLRPRPAFHRLWYKRNCERPWGEAGNEATKMT